MPNKTLFLKFIFKPGMQQKLRKGLAQEKHGPQPIHKETLTGPLTTKRLSTMLYFAPNHESTQHISYNCEKKVKVGSPCLKPLEALIHFSELPFPTENKQLNIQGFHYGSKPFLYKASSKTQLIHMTI